MQVGNPLGSLAGFAYRLFAPPEEKVVISRITPCWQAFVFFSLLQELNPRRRSLNVGSTVLEGP